MRSETFGDVDCDDIPSNGLSVVSVVESFVRGVKIAIKILSRAGMKTIMETWKLG